MPAKGFIIAVQEHDELRFLTSGLDAAAARTTSVVRLVGSLMPELRPRPDRFITVIQHWDAVFYETASIGYGRRRGQAPAVRLIPDAFFCDSNGYGDLRHTVVTKGLPAWADRQDLVFWRGSASPPIEGLSPDGAPIERLKQIPRVAMCLTLRNYPRSDAAIMWAPYGPIPEEEAAGWLTAEGIYRPKIEMRRHADYRYLIDIDGFANAWSFFEKLLLGSCILKVASRFEQWFYDEVAAWEHFVPVRADLSDLVEKIEWCREHDRQAQSIAARGQAFALGHTYDVARKIALRAIRESCIPF